MAVYGLGTPGRVPFTGYTNTLGNGDANVAATAGYVSFNGITQGDDRIIKVLRNGGSSKTMRALWRTLTNSALGVVATASSARVQAVQGGASGIIPVEIQTHVNRNTTAADRTALVALIDRVVFPASYPPDLSMNGGGGKGQW